MMYFLMSDFFHSSPCPYLSLIIVIFQLVLLSVMGDKTQVLPKMRCLIVELHCEAGTPWATILYRWKYIYHPGTTCKITSVRPSTKWKGRNFLWEMMTTSSLNVYSRELIFWRWLPLVKAYKFQGICVYSFKVQNLK